MSDQYLNPEDDELLDQNTDEDIDEDQDQPVSVLNPVEGKNITPLPKGRTNEEQKMIEDHLYENRKGPNLSEMEKYLAAAKLGSSPEAAQRLEARNKLQSGLMDTQGKQNLMSGLLAASNMFGTVAGKTPKNDTSAMQQSEGEVNQQLGTISQQNALDQSQEEKERQLAIQGYLAQKKGQTLQEMKNSQALNLQSKKASDARDLAGFKAGLKPPPDKSEKTSKRFSDLGNLMEGGRGAPADFKANQTTVRAADKLNQLGDQGLNQKGGLTPSQMSELASQSAALVGAGNAPALAMVEHFIPNSEGGNEAKIKQWLTNEPAGADQMAFAAQMLETAEREGHLAKEKMHVYHSNMLNNYSDLQSADPTRYSKMAAQYLGDAAPEFQEKGAYQMKPYTPSGKYTPDSQMANSGGGSLSSKIGNFFGSKGPATATAAAIKPPSDEAAMYMKAHPDLTQQQVEYILNKRAKQGASR